MWRFERRIKGKVRVKLDVKATVTFQAELRACSGRRIASRERSASLGISIPDWQYQPASFLHLHHSIPNRPPFSARRYHLSLDYELFSDTPATTVASVAPTSRNNTTSADAQHPHSGRRLSYLLPRQSSPRNVARSSCLSKSFPLNWASGVSQHSRGCLCNGIDQATGPFTTEVSQTLSLRNPTTDPMAFKVWFDRIGIYRALY